MKIRIDQLMYDAGLTDSREKAKRLIMSGIIYIDNLRVDKPGTKVDCDSNIEIRGKKLKYVSRGGLKLEKAIENYNINLKEKVCMDVGASTGGFTDCMLQNNAEKVYSIDVGYGQLDWKLRNHEAVINLEKTNMRYINFDKIGEKVDFISVDVSFISLSKIIPVLDQFTKDTTEAVILIKPQFEAGRENVKKNGVVREKSVHEEVLIKTIKMINDNHWEIIELTYSPVKGPKGNIEFLVYCKKNEIQDIFLNKEYIKGIVEKAHINL
ncbi:MAG: TlyA family RNA methyltransferase [Bacillota bacterium]|nr:TlyA family RNA methyltransferase [Bacillota bacterium]